MKLLGIISLTLGALITATKGTRFQAFDSPDCTYGAGSNIKVKDGGVASKIKGRASYRCTGDSCTIHMYSNEHACFSKYYLKTFTVSDSHCLENQPGFGRACVIGGRDKRGSGVESCEFPLLK